MYAGDFTIERGVNVSHWLSQTDIRGRERKRYVTEKDFIQIKELGFDHVRLPIDEEHFWTEDGKQQKAAFKLLDKAIKWAIKHDLKVIVDLHVLRSHHFNVAESRTLWEEESAQQQFIGFWKDLSKKLSKYPNDMLAYEPMNEAVSDDPQDWNKLINWVIREIREIEPERTIIMGSNNWQQCWTFPYLEVPESDKNIILSFHIYTPMPLTHWKAPWTNFSRYDAPVNYPGTILDTTDLANFDQETIDNISVYIKDYDREVLRDEIMVAVNRAKELGLPLYCGEFGIFPTPEMKMMQTWYTDMMAIFNMNGIAWAHWNWKNDFPLIDAETTEPISEILDILLSEE